MAEIIKFATINRKVTQTTGEIIEKLFDGEIVQCIDFELLSPPQLSKLLTENSLARSGRK